MRSLLTITGVLVFLWGLLPVGLLAAEQDLEESERAALAVTKMRCEYRTNPLGIDVHRPRLGWEMEALERGAMQSAYRIQVATSRDALRKGEDLLWDSGKVTSQASIHHAYEGPALEARRRYWWRVRVWDAEDRPSGWSEPAYWEMGLLEPSNWQAQWIVPGLLTASSTPQPSPMVRTEFTVEGEVASARAYVTAHGLYEMRINGQQVGGQVFAPGWTSYHERVRYQTYDIAYFLQQGENAVGAILGDGWYRGYIGFAGQRNFYGEHVALLAQIVITYEDGRTQTIGTDGSWTAATGPIRQSDIYMGETYDARLEKGGWTTPDYDADGWSPVEVADYPKDVLLAALSPPVRKVQEIEPVAIFETPEGQTVVDFGQNMVGWVRLRVRGEAGTKVTMQFAEVLDQEGHLYTANLRAAKQTDTYILSGEGVEVWEPHFTFHGFRYVAVEGYPGELSLDDLTGIVVHSDLPPAGHFESSHRLLNQLQHNIAWGQKGNFLGVPTDCPQRDERLGWTGDAQVFAETACFNMEAANFFRKWLRDLAADQLPNGSIPHVIPDVLSQEGQPQAGSAGWADAGVIIPWVLYQRYGDTRILQAQYESMKAWVKYAREQAAKDDGTYVWDTGFHFGDWLAFNTDRSDYPGATTYKDLIATAFFAHSVDLLHRTARVLGKEEDAQAYATLFEAVKSAFQKEFVTAGGRVTSNTQTSYVLALTFGLLPEELRDEAVHHLVEDIQLHGTHLTTGFLGTPYLAHALSRHGHLDVAYALLLQDTYPSWLYPITRGATTIWERWDGIKPDGSFQNPAMNSFNHYAYGAIGEWLYEVVAGIQPAAPGYKRILIQPRPGGGLSHARAFYKSMYGRIASSWTRTADEFRLTVTIPANTRATIRLPGAVDAHVTEGEAPLSKAVGITDVRPESGDVLVEVGAGRYVFVYPAEDLGPIRQADPYTINSSVQALLMNDEARAILQEYLPRVVEHARLEGRLAFPLHIAARRIPGAEASAETLKAVDAALREIEHGTMSAQRKVGVLLANRAARTVLRELAPTFFRSPWLSQTMGFSLERAVGLLPAGVLAEEQVQEIDAALQQLGQ